MGRKVSQQKRTRMFKVWSRSRAESFVSQLCKVHIRTVKRYRKLDNWDKRLKEIELKVQKKVDYDIQKEHERNLRLILAGKNYIIREMTSGDIKAKLGDISELIRTEQLLVGKPDTSINLQISDERIAEALELLRAFGGKGIKSLADQIAKDEKAK